MKDQVVAGLLVCVFAYRTYVATGMHSLIPSIFSSFIGRKNSDDEIEKGSETMEEQKHIPEKTDVVSPKEGLAALAAQESDIPVIIVEEPSIPAMISAGAFGISIKKLRKAAARRSKSLNKLCKKKTLSFKPEESERLLAENGNWKKWGPYLSDRQWSTVREDYSLDGSCWEYFPHDDARSRAYRWGEDGLLGLTDENCQLCFSLGLWNGKDPILKERLFGLTGTEGNHGEDCKECVYYLDSTPTHSYMKALYKYPQAEYPYGWLVDENKKRSVADPEFELTHTGVFNDNRYWDVYVEYAKTTPDNILIRITAKNRGPDTCTLYIVPQLWYRNTWSWNTENRDQPIIKQVDINHLIGENVDLGSSHFYAGPNPDGSFPTFLFTNNDTNTKSIVASSDSQSKYFKDAFHRYIVNGDYNAVNPEQTGTKCCALYKLEVPSNEEVTLKFKLSTETAVSAVPAKIDFGQIFDNAFTKRINDADDYYNTIIPGYFGKDQKAVARQGYAGVLWSKQYYKFDVKKWLESDTAPLAGSRRQIYSKKWKTLYYSGVFSVSDKWEYPWISNWDLSFNVVSLAKLDHRFAKAQLESVLRREIVGPEGEIPECEFNFSDASPPMNAWAVWRVYKLSCDNGEKDLNFLKMGFQALTFHFKWWLTKKDSENLTILTGGFFQMNNIGFFDSSKKVGDGLSIEMSDQCVWTMFYCQNLIKIAIELVQDDGAYEEVVTRLCETYIRMLSIIKKLKLWNNKDELYYNFLRCDKKKIPISVRSMASFVPLFGCLVIEREKVEHLVQFQDMVKAQHKKYPDFAQQISFLDDAKLSYEPLHIMTVADPDQLKGVLKHMFDENEFLSPYGIRSLSKFHKDNQYTIELKGHVTTVCYTPGESGNHLFGGNNNWSGPVWININLLIIESLEEYYSYYKDEFKVEFPTGSGNYMNLQDICKELCSRISKLLVPEEKDGGRPCHGGDQLYKTDKNWKDLVLFHECFDGDTGRGCGASHVTGWTALAINCMEKLAAEKNN